MEQIPDSLDAVVLAGGINRVPLFEGYTPGYKALVTLRGRPAIGYTLDALRAVPQIGRICIVGEENQLRPALENSSHRGSDYAFAPSADSLFGSLLSGLEHFAASPQVLLTTADLPLLTPQAVLDFLNACAQAETTYPENFYISVIRKEACTGPYASVAKIWTRFRDCTVAPGNLALASPRSLQNPQISRRVNAVYAARKSAIGSALAAGIGVGVSYVVGVHLLHVMTLRQMVGTISRRFGLGVVPVFSEHPGVLLDMDESSDYTLVLQELAERAEHATP